MKARIRIYHDPNERVYTYELISGDLPAKSPMKRILFVKKDYRNKDVPGSGRMAFGCPKYYTPSTQFIPLFYHQILQIQENQRRLSLAG